MVCLILFGFAYFFITGSGEADSLEGQSADNQAALLSKTQSFIERSRVLQAISIDAGFFASPVFISLRSFSTEVPDQSLGKSDIFMSAENSSRAEENEVAE